MSNWKIKQVKSLKLNNPILIEGLPGIGNVGKVAVDFLIDELKAQKIYEISSYTFPHSVFVNDKNLVELPKIEMYHKRFGKDNREFLFLAGDVQPTDEVSSYEFSEKIIGLCRKHNCKDIITLGGIGLMDIPKKPKIYCTGNSKKAIEKYKEKSLNTDLYGIVGPIVGVSGLLLGMADKGMNAVAFLAETYGHPMYLGFKSSKEVLKFLNKKFKFGLKIEKLDKEIKEMEADMMKRTEELTKVSQQAAADKIKRRTDISYIG
jgi:uncharacterized protein (TIGR00162 family)